MHVFDEIHYVTAARELVLLHDNPNWIHPPLGKLIMGVSGLVLERWLALCSELTGARIVAIGFGMWALWSVRAWMRALGYSERNAQVALWLTACNFLWFVQSKTAMLDIFFVAFASWGALDIYVEDSSRHHRFWRGWILLGLAMATKWSSAPFVLIALVLSRRSIAERVAGCAVAFGVYVTAFVPLGFLQGARVPFSGLVQYHVAMVREFDYVASIPHTYASRWWQWPTLIRPMWYHFDHSSASEQCIWAGGNPILYWVALPLFAVMGYFAVAKRDRQALVISLLYWIPLIFWMIVPRSVEFYYYYLPSSMWVGSVIVWANERLCLRVQKTCSWPLMAYTLLCIVMFLYFLPILNGSPLPQSEDLTYMWLESWI